MCLISLLVAPENREAFLARYYQDCKGAFRLFDLYLGHNERVIRTGFDLIAFSIKKPELACRMALMLRDMNASPALVALFARRFAELLKEPPVQSIAPTILGHGNARSTRN